MTKHTQQDLVVLALVQLEGWHRAYELEKVFVGNEMVGSEADTRCYEVFDKNVADVPHKITKREIDGAIYTVETKREGKNRLFKAYISTPKPTRRVEYDEVTGIARIVV